MTDYYDFEFPVKLDRSRTSIDVLTPLNEMHGYVPSWDPVDQQSDHVRAVRTAKAQLNSSYIGAFRLHKDGTITLRSLRESNPPTPG